MIFRRVLSPKLFRYADTPKYPRFRRQSPRLYLLDDRLLLFFARLFEGLYYLLNKRMPDHISLGKVDELYALDVAEYLLRLDESGGVGERKVNLGYVAGYDGLAAEAQAGEKHLHLLDSRVLRLVQIGRAHV